MTDTDNKYHTFGKQDHQKYLGFGTMTSTFFARGITNTLFRPQTRTTDDVPFPPEEGSQKTQAGTLFPNHLASADVLAATRKEDSNQHSPMANAAIKTTFEFPDIREDLACVGEDIKDASKALTNKQKQVRHTLRQSISAGDDAYIDPFMVLTDLRLRLREG